MLAAAGVGSNNIDIRGRFRDEQQCLTVAKLVLAAGASLADDATIAFVHLDNHTPRAFPAPLIRSVCQLADSVRTAQ